MKKLVNFIYEAATVKRIERVGFQVLGAGRETLGEHTFLTTVIAYVLAKQLKANMQTVLLMGIFHDFHEARTGDVHKLATFYVTRNQAQANADIFATIDPELLKTLEVYEEKKTLEARITYEANIVALLVHLKPLVERGDPHAKQWMENKSRLRLPEAIVLAEEILATDSQSWWDKQKQDLADEFAS